MNSTADKFDVVIAGAGPAGSSAAIRLAQAGLRVIMLERKHFPREKLCGEFVSPECLNYFDEMGVDLGACGGSHIEKTVFYARSGRQLTIPAAWLKRGSSHALGVSRSAMDLALIERARAAGVDVREGATVKHVKSNERDRMTLVVSIEATDVSIDAAIVIDARGRAKPLVSLGRRAQSAASHVAFKAHLAGVCLEPAACEMFVYRGGYGGCLPIEDGLHNLCFIAPSSVVVNNGSDPGRLMRNVVMNNRRASAVLSDAKVIGEWHAVPITALGPKDPVPAHRLLAVGDAAAFIDPFTGSGIMLALQSGKLAAETILTRFPDCGAIETEYRQRYAEHFNGRLRASSLVRYAFSAPLLAELALTVFASSELCLRRLAAATRSNASAGV